MRNRLMSPWSLLAISAASFLWVGTASETVTLQKNPAPVTLPVNEARSILHGVQPGDGITKVISLLGYPDEVRIPQRTKAVGEWRRWCYGVEAPGELPLIGTLLIGTNLTVEAVIPPAFVTKEATERPLSFTNDHNLKCSVLDIWKSTNYLAPELRYWVKVSVENTGEQTAVVPAEWKALKLLISYEVVSASGTVVFDRHPPFFGTIEKGGEYFSLEPSVKQEDQLAIFLSSLDLGIPRPGKYKFRFFMYYNETKFAASDFYEFEIGDALSVPPNSPPAQIAR
jgi:hypothetical protein